MAGKLDRDGKLDRKHAKRPPPPPLQILKLGAEKKGGSGYELIDKVVGGFFELSSDLKDLVKHCCVRHGFNDACLEDICDWPDFTTEVDSCFSALKLPQDFSARFLSIYRKLRSPYQAVGVGNETFYLKKNANKDAIHFDAQKHKRLFVGGAELGFLAREVEVTIT